VNTLARIATDTEEKNNIFRRQHADMVEKGRLFRFNVYHGLSDIGLYEHDAVDRIASCTQQYLNHHDTSIDIDRCVKSMSEGGQRLGIMGRQG
jgi:hypothetical protein